MVGGQEKILVVSSDEMFSNPLRRVLHGEYMIETTTTLPTSDPNVDLIVWHVTNSSTPSMATIGTFACPTLVVGPAQPEMMITAVEARAAGFAAENAPVDELVDAVAIVLAGGAVVPPEMLGSLLHHLVERRRKSTQPDVLSELTPREYEVFLLAANGVRRREIAKRLFISTNTVRTHLQRVYKKLNVHSHSELISLAARVGLLNPSEIR